MCNSFDLHPPPVYPTPYISAAIYGEEVIVNLTLSLTVVKGGKCNMVQSISKISTSYDRNVGQRTTTDGIAKWCPKIIMFWGL